MTNALKWQKARRAALYFGLCSAASCFVLILITLALGAFISLPIALSVSTVLTIGLQTAMRLLGRLGAGDCPKPR